MTTKTASDTALRKALSDYAVANGLDAEGVLARAQAEARRNLAAKTQAENAAVGTRLYDSCFGSGAFVADARRS